MAELDLKSIEASYAKMPDWKLEQIATSDASGLRPEVFNIIKKELEKRNLSLDLLRGVVAQNRDYTVGEIDTYCELLRSLPCPYCEQTTTRLNGTLVSTVKSFIIITTSENVIRIGCPSCLDKEHNSAILSTVFLGWWGFPWGILKTPYYIVKNILQKRKNHNQDTSDMLRAFTFSRIGEVESYLSNKEKLRLLIKVV